MTRDEFFNLLSLVLIVLPFIDWTAVVILTRALRRRGLITIRDRLLLAAGIAALSTLFAILALSRLGHLALPNDVVGTLLTAIVIFLSMVNLAFVVRYWGAAWGPR